MADITVTAGNVVEGSGSVNKKTGTSGEAITAGQVVYIKSSDSKLYKAQHDGTAEEAEAVGVALNSAPGSGQPVTYITAGNLDPGGTVTVGEIYVVSATAGGIAEVSDLVSTNRVTVLGVGTTASNIKLGILVSGVQKP